MSDEPEDYWRGYKAGLADQSGSGVLQAVLDAIKGTLDTSTEIADHPNVKFAQMQRLSLLAGATPEGWQPIETAPRHQAVLVFYEEYGEALTARRGERGWSVAGLSEHYVVQTPTFWRPLPAPPAPASEGQ